MPAPVRSAKDWVRILAKYREPSTHRSVLELLVTLFPFMLLRVNGLASAVGQPLVGAEISNFNGIGFSCVANRLTFRPSLVREWTAPLVVAFAAF